jgi:hypothetical protein
VIAKEADVPGTQSSLTKRHSSLIANDARLTANQSILLTLQLALTANINSQLFANFLRKTRIAQ